MSLPEITPVFIYGLCDPRTGELRYVGKTKQSLPHRLYLHIHLSKQMKYYSQRWIQSLIKSGVRPEIFIIEETDTENWQESERFWMSYFRFVGCRLVNIAEGGQGALTGRHHTQETKDILRKKTLEWYAKNGTRKGHKRYHTQQTRDKMSLAHKGKPKLALQGRKLSPEHIAKLSEIRKDNPKLDQDSRYIVTTPSGEEITVGNLAKFCRERNLSRGSMNFILLGKTKFHRGYTVRRF